MWTAFARGGLALAFLALLMQTLRWILDPITDLATSGPHSGAESVSVIGGWFSSLSVNNLTLIAALGVGIYILGRAAVERKTTP